MTIKETVSIWGMLILLSIILYSQNYNESPRGRHQSGMSNYFAVTLRFIDSGFNLSTPKTYCLNPQYSANSGKSYGYWNYSPKDPQGITAIDFPIHQYIIALIMKTLDSNDYSIYRLYMLIISLFGLYYLGKAVHLFTNSFTFSIVLVCSIFLSPTFSFFANNYLISPAALSFIFIAFYHFRKSFYNKRNYYYFLAFLTISALTRFPFIIIIIAYILNEIIDGTLNKKIELKKLSLSLVSLSVVIAYFVYNKLHLSYNFGSIFLSSPNTVKNSYELLQSLIRIITHKSWYYGTIIHYLFLAFIAITAIKKINTFKGNLLKNVKLRFLCIATMGTFIYSILMIRQFAYHDYYILDTYIPITVFWIVAAHQILDIKKLKQYKRSIILLMFLMLILNIITTKFDAYYRSDKPQELNRLKFENAFQTLDSLKISKNAKLLILDATGSNSPLLSFRRKGYSIVSDKHQQTSLENLSDWKYDYIITQNFTYKDTVLSSYPNFEKETTIFFTNDKFTIHTKK